MYALFLIVAFLVMMAAILGSFGFIAWAGVQGLNNITDNVRSYFERQRIKNTVMRRI